MSPAKLGLAQGLVVLALIGVCATLSTGDDGLSAGGPWKALSTSGTVENRRDPGADPAWSTVRRGDLLAPRSIVRTSDDGEVTLSGRAGVLMVDSETRLRLPGPSFGGALEATQDAGTVVYEAGGRSGSPLEVATPALVLVSGRGVFGVTVDDGWTLLSVEDGIVEIRPVEDDAGMDVHAGEAVRVRARDGHVEMLERDDRHVSEGASPAARRTAWKQHRRIRRVVARLDRELRQAEQAEDGLVTEGQPRKP